jgi:hypothetical protein
MTGAIARASPLPLPNTIAAPGSPKTDQWVDRHGEVVSFADRIDVESETYADAVVDAADEPVSNDGDGAPKADARTISEIAPAEEQVGLGFEGVVRVIAGALDDRLLGGGAARHGQQGEDDDRSREAHGRRIHQWRDLDLDPDLKPYPETSSPVVRATQ